MIDSGYYINSIFLGCQARKNEKNNSFLLEDRDIKNSPKR